jgi:peptidoglycan/xylan/chitin deacetylase (PgdA/CDA1 family)
MTARRLALALLRSGAVNGTTIALSRHRLRVLAYHDVPDEARFQEQLAWLVEHCTPVSLDQVVLAATEGAELPPRAVWVTFDDGDPSVVTRGLEPLRRHGVRATMFVCPGLIEADAPFWWEVVAAAPLDRLQDALGPGIVDHRSATAALKHVPDSDRRRVVADLPVLAPRHGGRHQLSDPQLDAWLADGHTLGSHTWDHPCLDHCSAEEQRQQILAADDWLRHRVEGWRPTFAYPNGNWSPIAEQALRERGYGISLLHDHRLSRIDDDPSRMSRLHTEADDPLDRFMSVVSGTQPLVRWVGRRLGRSPSQ